MKKLNHLHLIYGFWIALAVAAFALTGCVTSQPHVANSEGGTYTVRADGSEELRQGVNAKSATRLDIKRADGTRTRVELGTSRDPVVTVQPAPDYTRYVIIGIGAVAMIVGGVLCYKTWVRIGLVSIAGGLVLVIIGGTLGQYGWLWAAIAAGITIAAAAALYSGYRTGLREQEA